MLTKKINLLIIATLILLPVACSSAPNMKEGMWEITTSMNMGGMSMPAVTTKQCLTKKDMVPQQKTEGQTCSMSKKKVTGDTVSWTLVCTQDDGSKSESQGQITYQGTTMSGSVTAKISGGPMAMTFTSNFKGHWLGACP